MAEALHWKVYGVLEQRQYGRRLSKGFPDLVLLRGTRLIFAELKSEKGKLTPEQTEWMDALKLFSEGPSGGCGVYLWRPSDIESVVKILK